MNIKMRIYKKLHDNSGNVYLGKAFIREYDDADVIRFVQHALIEEGIYSECDISVDEIITN